MKTKILADFQICISVPLIEHLFENFYVFYSFEVSTTCFKLYNFKGGK